MSEAAELAGYERGDSACWMNLGPGRSDEFVARSPEGRLASFPILESIGRAHNIHLTE